MFVHFLHIHIYIVASLFRQKYIYAAIGKISHITILFAVARPVCGTASSYDKQLVFVYKVHKIQRTFLFLCILNILCCCCNPLWCSMCRSSKGSVRIILLSIYFCHVSIIWPYALMHTAYYVKWNIHSKQRCI